MRVGRRQLRGNPLMPKCRKAKISKNEVPGVDGCYGLYGWADTMDDDCLKCGAYVFNISDKWWHESDGGLS